MDSSDKNPEASPFNSVPSDTQQRKQEVFDYSVSYGMFPASHMILLAKLIFVRLMDISEIFRIRKV